MILLFAGKKLIVNKLISVIFSKEKSADLKLPLKDWNEIKNQIK